MLWCGIWSCLWKITKIYLWLLTTSERGEGQGRPCYQAHKAWMKTKFCVMSMGRPARHAKFTCVLGIDSSPLSFPTFQSSVMSPALKNPRFIMKLVIRWVFFCFESIHTGSHSPLVGDFRGTLWGWILGTVTDLSGLHKVGLLPSENITCFLVNLLPCSEGNLTFLTNEYVWGQQIL